MFMIGNQCWPIRFIQLFQKKTRHTIFGLRAILILCLVQGFSIPAVRAAQLSCSWGGGAGNWTDLNWNSGAGCNGVFPHNNGDTFNATLRTSIGAVTLDQDIVIQAFNFNGGTLTGTGNLIVNNVFRWTRGTLSGTGMTRANGGLDLSGGLKDLSGGRNLVNTGGQVANWTGGSIRVFNTSQLVNEVGATFNVTVDGGRMSGSSAARFINAGNLNIALSDVSKNVQFDSPPLDNNGTVNIRTGELRLGGGGASNGSFAVEANGRLNFSGGTHTLQAGSTVAGSNVEFSFKDSGGMTTIEGTYNVDNTTITGNTAIFNAVSSFTRTLTQTQGFLGGSGDLIVTGNTTLSGGIIQGPGRLITVGGLEIDGSFLTILDDRRILNTGIANWRSGGIRLNNTGTRFENAEGAILNILDDATMMIGGGGVAFGGSGESGAFTNRGTVKVDRSDTANAVSIDVNFFNLGTLDLNGDKLAFGPLLAQLPTGKILFDIGGPGDGEFDVLTVSGTALLGGVLEITLVDGFLPDPSMSFDVLIAQSIGVEDPDLGLLRLGGPDGGKFRFEIAPLGTNLNALRLISVIPIPATVWLFGSALFGLAGIGTKRSN